jgi:two-component system response regulator
MDTEQIYPGERYVLLVEDNEDDAELTLRAFKRHKLANRIIHVRDGVEALDWLFNRGPGAAQEMRPQPALVLLDINMPRMDGHEVLAAMREDPATSHVPVVMLTSSDEQRDILQAYNKGANSYVRKPVDFAEFIEAAGQLGLYWLMLNRGLE